ncbi:MAG: hypothetical protein GY754_23950 [bacterium]|nr:hypothetical protein [bacterium]
MKKILRLWVCLMAVSVLAFSGCEEGMVAGNSSGSNGENSENSGFSFSDMYSRMNTMEKEIKILHEVNRDQQALITKQEETIARLNGEQTGKSDELEGRIGILEEHVGEVFSENLDTRINGLEDNVGLIWLSDLSNDVSVLKTNVGAISIGTLNSDVNTLKTNVGSVSIAVLNSDLGTLKTNIGDTSIAAVNSEVSTLKSNVDTLLLGNLESRISGLEGSVGEISTASLNEKIETLESSSSPVGSIEAWHKNLPGMSDLPEGWVECNGQVIDDPDSPLYGETVPNLNGDMSFLRGGFSSGIFQEDTTAVNGLDIAGGEHGHSLTEVLRLPKPGTADTTKQVDCRRVCTGSEKREGRECKDVCNTEIVPGAGSGTHFGLQYTTIGDGSYTYTMTTDDGGSHSHSLSGDEETRPANMSVVWIIRIK